MKIRIGYGLGTRTNTNDADGFGGFVDDLERLGFDSLWLSERISGEAPDPLIALAFAAARTTKLKFGTSVLVVPGRNPVVLAKELATLDRLSGGRLLPAFGSASPIPTSSRRSGSPAATGRRSSTRCFRSFDDSGPRTRSTTTAHSSATTR
jgi:alkanesulfonate monooxygenase SsuD/methylene tetrahydromethanopterin reductase-like flavin-dependent oxidoreductase (luciferase family)